MNFDASDLKRLQWALAFLLLMAMVGAGSIWSTKQLQLSTEKAFRDSTAARRDIQNKLSRARDEEKELRDKIDRFTALKAKGYIGPEKRLDWVDAIGRIKVARRIFRLDYEFAPQRPVGASILPGGTAAGSHTLMSSQMQLKLDLLHEGELLAFLAELRDSVQAIVQVRSCAIERLPPAATDRSSKALLRAECILEWITLREGK